MQNFRSVVNSGKAKVVATFGAIAAWFKAHKINWDRLFNVLSIFALIGGVLALAVLVWLYVRPIALANIKVPVATDQASYAPGEEVAGIFFGDTYYKGEVRVLREVFCKDYKGVIKPPAESAVGDFFATQGRPRHLEGQTVPVGKLPADIPIGSNCVLQFTNVYNIQTPFGIRHEEYQYYTQNFSILSPERRAILDCEATGRKDCSTVNQPAPVVQPQTQSSPETQPVQATPQSSTQSNSTTENRSTTNNTTNNTTVNNPPAEPAPRYEERCTVDFLVRLGCRQVLVQ